MQYLDDGVDTKCLHAGWAVHSGMRAVDFVEMGFEGPPRVIDGRLGLYATHVGLDKYNRDAIVKPIAGWGINETTLRRYACTHHLQAHFDALLALIKEHDLRVDDVSRIRAGIHEAGLRISVGSALSTWRHKAPRCSSTSTTRLASCGHTPTRSKPTPDRMPVRPWPPLVDRAMQVFGRLDAAIALDPGGVDATPLSAL
jgi:2-methylcitrate dehydratase PrpD